MMIGINKDTGMRKWVIFGLIVAGLIGISRCSDDSKTPASAQPTASQPASSQEPVKQSSKWSYSQEEDKMRGSSFYLADLPSDNFINQDFPYQGNVHLNLRLQKMADGKKDVVLYIDKGQIPCHEDGFYCYFSVKFDDGPIHKARAIGSGDGSSNVIFLKGDIKKFTSSIRKAKKITVEVSLFQEGRRQFFFSPEGLDWKHF